MAACQDHYVSDWIPLLEKLVWPVLIGIVLVCGRRHWDSILRTLKRRIARDDLRFRIASFTAEFTSRTRGIVYIHPDLGPETVGPPAVRTGELTEVRDTMGRNQRGVHLVHVVAPSEQPGQAYDVFTYLHGWKRERFRNPSNLWDVTKAEFFLGPQFDPDSITVENKHDGKPIGFVTSANAPVLCLCRVTFDDGHEVVLSRYLDFESGKLAVKATHDQSTEVWA